MAWYDCLEMPRPNLVNSPHFFLGSLIALVLALDPVLAGQVRSVCPGIETESVEADQLLVRCYESHETPAEAVTRVAVEASMKDLQAERSTRAVSRLRIVMERDPGPKAGVLLAYLLLELRRDRESLQVLEQVEQLPGPELFREEARNLRSKTLASAASRETELAHLLAQAELALGWNSNVFSTAAGSEQENVQVVARPAASLSVNLVRPVTRRKHLGLDLAAQGLFEETGGLPAERYLTATLRADASIGLGATLKAEVSPRVRTEFLGGKPYLFRYGGRLGLRRGEPDRGFRVELDYSRNSARAPALSYLMGRTLELECAYAFSWRSAGIELQGSYLEDWTQEYRTPSFTFPLSYRGWSAGASLGAPLGGPWKLRTQLSWSGRVFPTRTQPFDLERFDLLMSFRARLERELGRGWGAFFSGSYLRNLSTLGSGAIVNKNFDQVRLWGGVAADFSI